MEREENDAEYSKAFNVHSQTFVITGDRVVWYTSTKSLLYQAFKYFLIAHAQITPNKKIFF